MIFQKRSTRTRVSTEGGFSMLGGHALFLGSEDIQLGKNESMVDTARVLSRFNDIILARVFAHADIEQLCKEASVPVINALSDAHHPLQGLADFLTLVERCGGAAGVAGKTLAWVGDGNNILHTLLQGAPKLGMHVQYATPRNYEPDAAIVAAAAADAAAAGTRMTATHDPAAAVAGANVIVTDTWVSMGHEADAARRLKDFTGYQVTEALARKGGAAPDWTFLHCLPRKPQEVDDAVFYGPRSLVWDEAENRMWTVMAVALAQLQGGLAMP
jgi:ornithine carbamoyltransferase